MRILGIFCLLVVIPAAVFAQKQGIRGQVFWLGGNQMPGPGPWNPARPPQQGIVREVHVYQVASLADVVVENNYYREVHTKLVATAVSGRDGYFRIKLPPGEYSVFTLEPKGLFANIFDTGNRINPVVVKPGKYTWVTITIDYEAAY
jgi:hypothetical protein